MCFNNFLWDRSCSKPSRDWLQLRLLLLGHSNASSAVKSLVLVGVEGILIPFHAFNQELDRENSDDG